MVMAGFESPSGVSICIDGIGGIMGSIVALLEAGLVMTGVAVGCGVKVPGFEGGNDGGGGRAPC